MACVCGNDRIMEVSGKTSDMCFVEYDGYETEGYVPRDLNIGGGDYLQFKMCLECAAILIDETPRFRGFCHLVLQKNSLLAIIIDKTPYFPGFRKGKWHGFLETLAIHTGKQSCLGADG
jgi:hypothetical protein